MEKYLWQKCLECNNKICCKSFFPASVFLTPDDQKNLPEMNKKSPCAYLDKNNLCTVQSKKSFDCKIFPFDIISENGKYFWVIWKVDCKIIKEDRDRFEEYLQDIEEKLMPGFKKYIKEFDEWQDKEYKDAFDGEIIREIKFY